VDLNHRPLGYEPNELPDCSTPHFDHNQWLQHRQTSPPSDLRNRLRYRMQPFRYNIPYVPLTVGTSFPFERPLVCSPHPTSDLPHRRDTELPENWQSNKPDIQE
jgi:hypothetical protein